ncbi:MAG: quinone-dependent dihydroorotate dehydrogenase, partial [Gammaproteobacteria bacterium]|nr:quinone-dependent dihydroorotate dehydrogenase [Gammaproteobacteria bacterium]
MSKATGASGWYAPARNLLFRVDPERAHRIALTALRCALPVGIARRLHRRNAHPPVRLLGLQFDNRVGLAAGLDKDGDYIAALYALGFGFLELGTVTPRPQTGNPMPRLFRLPRYQALINRMGFNNRGVDHLADRLERFRRDIPNAVIGVNIGKNRDTPLAQAGNDYAYCLRRVYHLASYVAINISSPNTPGLRELQETQALDKLLAQLNAERRELEEAHGEARPLLVKIAPDLADADIPGIVETLLAHRIDGVIATNTTATRDGVTDHPLAQESGGLSGAPLAHRAEHVLQCLQASLRRRLPVISV